jgi:RNA polymerase sigma-70 factor, ECF subfamily
MRAADHEQHVVDLREIVVEHRAQIFRYARKFSLNNADAEDLAQSAVVRALQRGPIECTREQAKAYVLRIVHNLAVDQARSRGRVSVEPHASLPEAVSSGPLPEELVLRADAAAEPRAAFAALEPQHREVLRLRFLDDLSYDKVAERLDVTEHAARQRVYRAMQALRAAMHLRPT